LHGAPRGWSTLRRFAAHYRRPKISARSGAPLSNASARAICGPGFCDLQCNGFAGIDFNHPESTPEQIATAIITMRSTGVTQVLPTLITAAVDRLEHLLRTIVQAIALDRAVRDAVPGIHLEGPWISDQDGARGAHPAAHVRPIDRRLWRRLQRAAEGNPLVTVAPEPVPPPLIRQLRAEQYSRRSATSPARSRSLPQWKGALLSTHLGNGCPQMLHRHWNPIYAQLPMTAWPRV
jgi:N-acetylglucosamine-6-phosphate deacetylase